MHSSPLLSPFRLAMRSVGVSDRRMALTKPDCHRLICSVRLSKLVIVGTSYPLDETQVDGDGMLPLLPCDWAETS
jgi:hypothetical protein